jgi:hypothetical protein
LKTKSLKNLWRYRKQAKRAPTLGMTHYDIHSGVGGRGVPPPRCNKGYKPTITDCKVIAILHSVGLALVS